MRRPVRKTSAFLILFFALTGCFGRASSVTQLKADTPLTLAFKFPEGWKINADAPSIVKIVRREGASDVPIKTWGHADLQTNPIGIGELTPAGSYRLDAVIYYCEKQDAKVCLVKKVSEVLEVGNYSGTRLAISFE